MAKYLDVFKFIQKYYLYKQEYESWKIILKIEKIINKTVI